MDYRLFNIKEHHVVEIDQFVNAIESDEVEKVWIWEIYIASDGQGNYRGKAVESSGEFEVPWTELSDDDLIQEMVSHCQIMTLQI
ncbi:hypothetical protein [Peribacillus alkalitolerans]|uniref:hypothetical protein n=1 Tax=Peribacillus alkalitolerans TaxID=1550385 RepID=UPI0013D34721|nr:hypothetical protein [Peribacillus alkalitolerans]